MTRLPMRTYWMLAFAASLALHAGALGAGLYFLGSSEAPPAETEIRFAAAPAAAILKNAAPEARLAAAAPAEAEIVAGAAPAERLAPAEPERAAPLAAERLANLAPSERMAPAETERAAPVAAETAAPVSEAVPAERPATAERAAPEPAEPPAALPPPERLAPAEPERAATVAPERLAPIAGRADMALTAPGAERLGAAPPVEAQAAANTAEPPPAPAAAAETLAPSLAAESLPALAPERAQPAPAERLAAAPAIAAPPEPADMAEAGEPERLAAVAPEREIGAAASPEAAAPESGASTASETLAPAAPSAAERLAARTDAAEGGAPATAAGAASATETLSPAPSAGGAAERIAALPGGPETAAPAASAAIEAIRPIEPGAIAGDGAAQDGPSGGEAPVAPQPSSGETIAPAGEARETVTASLFQPSLPGAALGVDPEKPTDLYRRAVDFVGSFEGGDCFVALPSVDRSGGVAFKAFGKDQDREKTFAAAYRREIGLDAAINLGDINAAQCAAIGFARNAGRYPDFGLILRLAADTVTSGSTIAGQILSVKGRALHALIVDDEGRIQAIDSLVEPEADGIDYRFAIPVTLTGGPVATKQLLIAIASDRALPLLDGSTDRSDVDVFFRTLEQQVSSAGATIDIAIAGFSVEPEPAADAGR